MTGRPRILFHVQHLLGIGHLMRAARLARVWAASGFEVELLSGGMPVAGLDLGAARLVQLPPMRARDERFTAFLDESGREIDEAWRARRRAALLDHVRAARPDVVVIEMFPFGRRMLRFELLPLLDALDAARPRPLVVASVRDILQTGRKPGRTAEAAALVRRRFDAVMVHGDPAVAGFEETFPEAGRIADRLHYTGYVAPPRPRAAAPSGEVIVSAGGGAVGAGLLRAALAARPLTSLAGAPWRLLAGSNMAAAAFEELRRAAPPGVTVERARADFAELLAAAALSISQAGYNTVMDVLTAKLPAVLVPFAGAGETEQSHRAARLAALGLATVVEEAALSPETLAAAVDRARATDPGGAAGIDLDGAAASARLLTRLLAAHRDRPADGTARRGEERP